MAPTRSESGTCRFFCVRAPRQAWSRKPFCSTDGEQSVELGDAVEWAVVNAGGHGFYRVRYGADLFDALKHGLQVRLSAVERFSLVNDTWAATLAGLTSLIDYLSLIDLLQRRKRRQCLDDGDRLGASFRANPRRRTVHDIGKAPAHAPWTGGGALRLDASKRVRAIWKASCAAI